MIIMIWSYWYDHIDIITLIWSYWYDHYDMITSNLYIFGGSVSIKFSWILILKESTTIMRIDMLSFSALKGVNNLIMSLSLRRESCKWPNLLLIQISLIWSYHWYENVIYVIIILIWSYYWRDHIIGDMFKWLMWSSCQWHDNLIFIRIMLLWSCSIDFIEMIGYAINDSYI